MAAMPKKATSIQNNLKYRSVEYRNMIITAEWLLRSYHLLTKQPEV